MASAIRTYTVKSEDGSRPCKGDQPRIVREASRGARRGGGAWRAHAVDPARARRPAARTASRASRSSVSQSLIRPETPPQDGRDIRSPPASAVPRGGSATPRQGASKAPSRHRRPAIDGPGWAPPCELVLVSLPSPHPPWHKRIVLCRLMFANHAAKLSVSGKQRPAFPEISKTVSLLSCRKACGIVPVSWLWLR